MEQLQKFATTLLSIVTGKSIGYAIFLGLVISLCVTAVTIFLLNGTPLLDHHPPIENGWRFLCEFLLLSVLVASLTVFMTSRENDAKQREVQVAAREANVANREKAVADREGDDLLSKFRGQIVGIWAMTFRSWSFNDDGEPEESRNTNFARFDINNKTKKLVMRTKVSSTGEFDERNIAIEAISIWPVNEPKYLDYFHHLGLTHENGDVVQGPIFVHLDIEFDDDRPVRLRGTWYDLDGVFSRARREHFVRSNRAARGDLPLRGRISFEKLDAEQKEKGDVEFAAIAAAR